MTIPNHRHLRQVPSQGRDRPVAAPNSGETQSVGGVAMNGQEEPVARSHAPFEDGDSTITPWPSTSQRLPAEAFLG
jgi:hypothetical protein